MKKSSVWVLKGALRTSLARPEAPFFLLRYLHLYAPVLCGTRYVLRHVLHRALHVLVLHVSPKGSLAPPTPKRTEYS